MLKYSRSIRLMEYSNSIWDLYNFTLEIVYYLRCFLLAKHITKLKWDISAFHHRHHQIHTRRMSFSSRYTSYTQTVLRFSILELDLMLYSATSLENEDDLSSINFSGVSYSLRSPASVKHGILISKVKIAKHLTLKQILPIPLSNNATISLSSMDVILWAIVITVESVKCCLSVCWIILSVAVSTDAVASSRTRTLLFFSSTLPRQTNCLWPTLQFSPFSDTVNERSETSDEESSQLKMSEAFYCFDKKLIQQIKR